MTLMKFIFNIEYQTTFGEQLVLNILNGDGTADRFSMATPDGHYWFLECTREAEAGGVLHYYYSVQRGDEVVRQEWQVEPHCLELSAALGSRYMVYDRWIDIPEDSYLYSSAFTDCVAARKHGKVPATNAQHTLMLKVRAPQLRSGEHLAVVGSADYLGCWDCAKAVPMTEQASNEWMVCLDAHRLPVVFEFKFIVLGNGYVIWENCQNRSYRLPDMPLGEVVVSEQPQSWFSIPQWRGAGTVIPSSHCVARAASAWATSATCN